MMLTAQVRIQKSDESFLTCRLLLDSGSTTNLVTENLVKKLKLKTESCAIAVGAVNDLQTIAKAATKITFYSKYTEFNKTISCLVMPKIVDRLPSEVIHRGSINIPKNIRLADPTFHIPREVDIVIGSGATVSLLSVGQIDLSKDGIDLFLQKSKLGWLVAGGIPEKSYPQNAICHVTDLKRVIEKFWILDTVDSNTSELSEENQSETHYVKNVTRDSSGRYIVKLPFKTTGDVLGESRSVAYRRFTNLLKKFNQNSEFKEQYVKVMNDYIQLGHMTLIDDEPSETHYYLPHHAVIKPTSSTTKTRVVFDASAKTDSGISLNDALLTGPTIQPKLFEHLIRFRSYPYVVTADIAQMYRQVWVHPEHRRYQQIFWLHENKIKTYQLNTVTFGVSSAPFLAIRTLNELAKDEGSKFPIGAKALLQNFYVDDFLGGANSQEELLQLRNEVIQILKRGGFEIRKWASNTQEILKGLEQTNKIEFLTDEESIHKTLGISWDTSKDEFSFTVRLEQEPSKITKRNILSTIAKIYDPLGHIGPVIFTAKKIMQSCWKDSLAWDESVSQTLETTWSTFIKELKAINNFKIPRFVLIENYFKIEIHGFSDASKSGYGACIYIRSTDNIGNTRVMLLCSRSRIAPMKERTIPQLELCGTLTLARLYKEICPSLTFSPDKIVFWTDSSIVLHWLKKHPSMLKVFESHRVAEIQHLSKNVEWQHVRSDQNPADALSRGQSPQEFLNNSSWLKGPIWLAREHSEWPRSLEIQINDLPGLKRTVCLLANPRDDEFLKNIAFRVSSYTKLIRIFAYCLRFTNHSQRDNQLQLTLTEIDKSEICVIKLLQRESFGEEIDRISDSVEPKSARLGQLSPFLDENGVLRVGGRISRSDSSFNTKHPILFPSRNHITDLLIRYFHEKYYHTGNNSTLYNIRQKYWVIDGRNQVRNIIRKCVRCRRFQAKPVDYKMSDLPQSRLKVAHIFYHTGIDFFGPIFIKEKKEKNRVKVKAYGCVFVCMTTRAVHIELVSDLSTEAFLAALSRFVSLRGKPAHVYSDNGTNFVGANSKLRELYVLFESKQFKSETSEFLLKERIEWHFNPPLSPHFGGLWEAAVKSCKHHLKRVIGERLYTFENLQTLLYEIAAIMNSRPICPLSSDANDLEVLTPAHYLIGRPFSAPLEQNLTDMPDNRLTIWEMITKARQEFWQRWQVEYLTELQKRQKWYKSDVNIKKDSIVLLIDKNQPCMQWRMGRVVEVHPGADDVVRVVTVKTQYGIYKRNTRSLCPLLPRDFEVENSKI